MVVREKEGDRQSGGEGSREGKQDGGGDGGEEGRGDGRTGEGGLTGFTQAGCSPGPVIGRVDGLEELLSSGWPDSFFAVTEESGPKVGGRAVCWRFWDGI